MNLASLSSKQLRRAADLKEKIAALEKELAQILGATTSAATTIKTGPSKNNISAAGRARIAAAARARWARVKAAKAGGAKSIIVVRTTAPAKKRGMSTAAKAKLSAKLKAAWAKRKAAAKK